MGFGARGSGFEDGGWASRRQEQITSLEAQARRLQEQSTRAQQKLMEIDVEVASRDQCVTVSVNSSGIVRRVLFSARSKNLTPPQLSASFMEAYRQACSKASRQMVDVMSDVIGSDSTAMEFLKSHMAPSGEESGVWS